MLYCTVCTVRFMKHSVPPPLIKVYLKFDGALWTHTKALLLTGPHCAKKNQQNEIQCPSLDLRCRAFFFQNRDTKRERMDY